MTEAEWLACTDPRPMLKFLWGKASDRKLRLFACACCRRIWHLLLNKASQNAVEVAELHADGLLSETERDMADAAAYALVDPRVADKLELETSEAYLAAYAALWAIDGQADNAMEAAVDAIAAVDGITDAELSEGDADLSGTARQKLTCSRDAEREAQCVLLCCIFGNSFCTLSLPLPTMLAWNGGLIPRLARSAYENRIMPHGHLDLACLGALSDALEEAGCTNADILNHLRQPAVHVRGCWVVDLLLGKE